MKKQWVGSNLTPILQLCWIAACGCYMAFLLSIQIAFWLSQSMALGLSWRSFTCPSSLHTQTGQNAWDNSKLWLIISLQPIRCYILLFTAITLLFAEKDRDGSSVHSDLCCCRGRHYYGSFPHSPWQIYVCWDFMCCVQCCYVRFTAHCHGNWISSACACLCMDFSWKSCLSSSSIFLQRRVIRTRSVKYMPFFLSLANLMNGIVWLIYALIKIDAYMMVMIL